MKISFIDLGLCSTLDCAHEVLVEVGAPSAVLAAVQATCKYGEHGERPTPAMPNVHFSGGVVTFYGVALDPKKVKFRAMAVIVVTDQDGAERTLVIPHKF